MSFIKKNVKPIIITLSVAIVVICAVLLFIGNTPKGEEMGALPEIMIPPGMTIIADKDTVSGIEKDSGFILHSPEIISVAAVRSQLSFAPAVEYTLEQRTNHELYIRTASELAPDTVYNIMIAGNSYEPPVSWAFQTKNDFRVTRTFPANNGGGVPVNSGIELYFSQNVTNIGQFATISPTLAGRFEQFDDKTVVFLPASNMEYDTTYTITLAADLPSQAGDMLGEEYSFSFNTESYFIESRNYSLYPYDGLSETFTGTDPIFIKLYANSAFADTEVTVALYRYANLDAYLAAQRSDQQRENDYLPTEGLTKIAEYTDRLLMNTELYWSTAFLPLQENPGLGWYLVDIHTPAGITDTGNRRTQKLLQVTDITVYSQTANNQMLFWLNDAQSGKPMAEANISVEGQTARSDQNGLALLDIPRGKDDRAYNDYREVRIEHGGQLFGEYLAVYGENEVPLSKLYYSYVYTDRAVYLPDDTVHFWGIILPRMSNAAKPGRIKLNWTDGGKYPDGIEIEIRADGSFEGEIKLEKHVSGWEYLNFTLDDKTLVERGFAILQYVKPIYTANMTVDKPYYRKNDTVNVVASANFYDGTPAEGLEVSLTYRNSDSESVQLHIDENGRGQAAFKPSASTSWHPRYDSISGRTISAEDQSVYFNRSVLVFPSDYMLHSSSILVEGGFALHVEGYHIDFSPVDSGENYTYNGYEKLRGASAEMGGEAQLYQVEYIKRKTGEYYDFINKVMVDRFTYDREVTVVETFPIKTEAGRFTSQTFYYPKEDNKYYYFELNCICPNGALLTETQHAQGYQSYYYYYNNQRKQYYFRQDDTESTGYNDDYYNYNYYYDDYYYYSNNTSGNYGLFDTIDMRLTDQDDQTPEQGRLLYTVLGKELFSYHTVNGSHFSVEFKPQYTPNAIIVGAYFDGKHIFKVFESSFGYRYDDNMLNISVTPDKERYRPGEEVTLTLRVTDKQGQRQAANYLLSVVDEAAFAIGDQIVNPLGQIYRTNYISYRQYASYIEPYGESGAECGGEGDADSVRRDFVDTVAFMSGQTNASGEATIEFKLADNITSWRLTSIAFHESTVDGVNMPYAGKDIKNIESGLPFFINQVLNEKYLAGDSVGLSLRGAGTDIRSSDTVHYEVSLSGGDVNIEKSKEAPAGDFCLLDLGTLPAGTYKVLIRARCGNYSDALEKELEVVDSLLLTSRYESGDLNDGIRISAKRFPVSIVLYDVDNTLFYNILYQMLYAYGQRADQIIARALAGKRLNEINADSHYSETLDLDGEEAYYWRNGLRLLPYAETDTLLTAKAVAAAPEFLNQAALADYFMRVIQNSDSSALDIAAAYMGLGALKKPILLDLRKLFAQAQESEDFTLEETLYLATGLALLGDTGIVSDWYADTIHSKLTSAGNTLCYQQSDNAHEDYQLTAAAAMLACLINHPDHRQLLLYLITQHSRTYLPLLELATYVGKYSPKPDSTAIFSYQLAGKTIQQAFDKRRQLYLEFGEAQLAEANFQVLAGSVGYNVYYFGGFDEAEKTLPEGVAIKHSLSLESVKLGDVVTVTTTLTFSGDAPIGYYHISQIVPTGLRFTRVKDHSYYDSNWYYRLGEGGIIHFYINPVRGFENTDAFNRPYMPASVTFSYEARAVLPGTYIMEAPAISYFGSNTLYAGERHHISVVK